MRGDNQVFKPASVSSLTNYKFFNNVAGVKITLKIINMNECARHGAKYLIFIISLNAQNNLTR